MYKESKASFFILMSTFFGICNQQDKYILSTKKAVGVIYRKKKEKQNKKLILD